MLRTTREKGSPDLHAPKVLVLSFNVTQKVAISKINHSWHGSSEGFKGRHTLGDMLQGHEAEIRPFVCTDRRLLQGQYANYSRADEADYRSH